MRQRSNALSPPQGSNPLSPPEIAPLRAEPGLEPLPARFMRPDGREHSCSTVGLSGAGALFLCEAAASVGEPLVAYIEGLGRVEAIAGEAAPGGFAVHFTLAGARLERFEKNLRWLLLKQRGLASEERKGTRFAPGAGAARVTLSSGAEHACEVLDISLSGAAIRSDARPELGSCVLLGRTRGRVIRHLTDGFAMEFVAPLEQDELRHSLR